MTAPVPARHRAPTRPPPPTRGKRIAPRTRPRYGRIAAFTAAFVVTIVSVTAGLGIIPTQGVRAVAVATSDDGEAELSASTTKDVGAEAQVRGTVTSSEGESSAVDHALPWKSGSGRRIVFDQSDQRVWLVGGAGKVIRTYLVSGSLSDNLDPGTYNVYSKSRWAVGVGDSGVMQYFVRFAEGNNAAIGFHTIPTKNGVALQRKAQLGTPQSHGCIRQRTADAIALWNFAPEGTKVVVTA